MVSLYIENRYIELDKEVQFAITKTFEDISNPTSIINDWSKTVSIPFTDKNNETFGYIYNPDRLTIHDETLSTGLYFDPLKKLDFRLEWDSAVLMMGYAKMTSVTKTNGTGRYNLTLNGELGKVFQEMKKITFDSSVYTGEDKTKYYINGEYWVNEEINRDYIYNVWNYDNQLLNLDEQATQSTDIIGFTPNNSYSENFNYDSFQTSAGSSKSFVDVLDSINFSEVTGVKPNDVIKDGLLPRDIGEFRSYNQIPFIFFNKLFQLFNKQTETATGYSVITDSDWFSEYNPYWKKLVVIGKRFDTKQDYSKAINNYSVQSVTQFGGWTSSYNSVTSSWLKNITIIDEEKPAVVEPSHEDLQPDTFVFPDSTYSRTMLIKATPTTPDAVTLTGAIEKTIVDNNALRVRLVVKDRMNFNTIVEGRSVLIMNETTTQFNDMDADFIRIPALKKGAGEYGESDPLGINLYAEIPNNLFNGEYVIYIEAGWLNNNQPFGQTVGTVNVTPIYLNMGSGDNIQLNVRYNKGGFRSNSNFTLNDLWNNDYNIFDFIINYCKIFRIGIFVDSFNKQIKYIPYSKYFKDYTITDWTAKLDVSKEYKIEPITMQNKYILFNYEDNKTALNKSYKELFGVNYGEMRITTDYNFNSETKQLFKGVKNGITATDTVLSWDNLYDNKIIYNVGAEVFVNNKDSSNKEVDVFGQFYFDNGTALFDTEKNLRSVSISDDSLMQLSNSTFIYSQYRDNRETTKYRTLDIYDYDTNYSCLFAKPKNNYTYKQNFDNQLDIYSTFWKNYLDERYNTNNKIVSCYLDITPTDYINFEFNKFIKIENQLYFVNKIYDYDITSNSTTKVDLVTIQDIEGYTTDNFDLKYFEVYNVFGAIWDNELDYIALDNSVNKRTIYVSSNSDVTISIKNVESGDIEDLTINGVDALDIYNGYYSTINAGFKVPVDFSVIAGGSDFRCIITLTNKEGKSIDITVVNVQ